MTENSPNIDEWAVVIEYQIPAGASLAPRAVVALIGELGAWKASGLCCADRYAVQIQVMAERPSDALKRGLQLHAEAARVVGLAAAILARGEVMTSSEFDTQVDSFGPSSGPAIGVEAMLPADVYLATRAMFQATTAAQLDDILADFVVSAGGAVQLGTADPPPEHVGIDMSLEDRNCRLAVVESFTVAGILLEHALPTLVDDARAVLARLCKPDPCRPPPG